MYLGPLHIVQLVKPYPITCGSQAPSQDARPARDIWQRRKLRRGRTFEQSNPNAAIQTKSAALGRRTSAKANIFEQGFMGPCRDTENSRERVGGGGRTCWSRGEQIRKRRHAEPGFVACEPYRRRSQCYYSFAQTDFGPYIRNTNTSASSQPTMRTLQDEQSPEFVPWIGPPTQLSSRHCS